MQTHLLASLEGLPVLELLPEPHFFLGRRSNAHRKRACDIWSHTGHRWQDSTFSGFRVHASFKLPLFPSKLPNLPSHTHLGPLECLLSPFLGSCQTFVPHAHLLTCRTELSVPGLTWCACEGASKSSRMKLFSFHETASGPSFTHWFVLSLPPSFLLKSTISPA